MPPRFMQRLERQAQVHREVFGEISHDPPPYPFSRSRSGSVKSQSTIKSTSTSAPPPQYSKEVNQGHSNQSPFLPGPVDSILPKDSLILVTAANSFQGIHIVDQLLAHGFRVRGAVRDAAKAVWTSKLFKHRYGPGRYTTSIVTDMVPRHAYDLAVRSCAGVIHCASVTKMDRDPLKVIAPSIAGALNALASAARESSVKRFVYCSSLTAAVDPAIGRINHVNFESWNMECFQAAWNGSVLSSRPDSDMERAWSVQCSAKFQTEQAVWRFYREKRPDFELNTVLPGVLWGSSLSPEQNQPTSMNVLNSIFHGDAPATTWLPAQHFTNVRDSALLHVAALLLPDVRSRRLFAATAPYNVNDVLSSLRSIYPSRTFLGDVKTHGVDGAIFDEQADAENLLRRMGKEDGWTGLNDTVQECCDAWISRAKQMPEMKMKIIRE